MKLFTILLNIAKRIKTAFSRLTTLETWQSDTADYVVECYNGTNEGYTKWSSGKCEIWKRITKSLSATVSWGSIRYGTYTDGSITYTMTGFTGFTSNPVVHISVQAASGNIIGLVGDNSTQSTTGIGTYYVYSPTSQSNINCTINVRAVGKWK